MAIGCSVLFTTIHCLECLCWKQLNDIETLSKGHLGTICLQQADKKSAKIIFFYILLLSLTTYNEIQDYIRPAGLDINV